MVAPSPIGERIAELLESSRIAFASGDTTGAWGCLEDAHVLSQPWAVRHVQVHMAMLSLGWRIRSAREMSGQIARLVVAGPASLLARYPSGNSGRADVSAFEAAPIRPDLADLLAEADAAENGTRVLDVAGVRRLYDRMAPFYDLASKPYDWVGARRLVDRAILELRLQPGDTVVDLGTGTGRNLIALADIVGPTGHVIGVDVSPRMLSRARSRIEKRGLRGVVLVEADIATFGLPVDVRAVLSTYAIEMLPNYQAVIGRFAGEMAAGGRIAVTGLRDPDRWPEWTIRVGSALNRPFGVAKDYRSHRPWEAIEAHTTDTIYEEGLAGAVYLAAGTATGPEGERS